MRFAPGRHRGLSPPPGPAGSKLIRVMALICAGGILLFQKGANAAQVSDSGFVRVSALSTLVCAAQLPTVPAVNDISLAFEEADLVDRISGDQPSQLNSTVEPELPSSVEIIPEGHEQAASARHLHYHVGLTVRQIYDDNINLGQFNRDDDFFTTIEPSIDLSLGDPDTNFLDLNYTPNAFIFANHSENDALQHIISLTGQYRFPLLTLTLSQDIQILDGTGLNTATGTGTSFTRTNLDVAGRTRVNIYTTRLDANYSLTGKTFLTGGLSYSLSDYPDLIGSSVLSGNAYFNYTYSPKLAIGLGLTGGYEVVDSPSEDQTFEQINARASYELTGKVSATFSAGVEFRQSAEDGANDNGSPIFEGSLFYQPFDGTSLALTLSRRTLSSATLASQDFHTTSVILSVRQRFLQRFYLGLTGGYENSSYFSTTSGVSSNREDDYYFLQASLDLNLTNYWTAGIFYLYRESDSSLESFSFYDNQFGFQTSLTY